MKSKIVCFSDTHRYHHNVALPECDIAIFAGDYSSRGSKSDTQEFLYWFNKQDQCKHKVFIAGNHDICFDPKFEYETDASLWLPQLLEACDNLTYLENSSVIINGLLIYGSPITPWFYGDYWAFNAHRGDTISTYWEDIPRTADIVVTHGPVDGIGDYIPKQKVHVGCDDLKRVIKEVKPALFVCGHIHEAYGTEQVDNTVYVNASICDEAYRPYNQPVVITL